jgi:hypothetical protein
VPGYRHRRWLSSLAAAVLPIVLVACSDGGNADGADTAGACVPPNPAPQQETALIPEGLFFENVGTVTDVEKAGGHITMQAVSAIPIDELTVNIQDAVAAAGYRPAGMDNEGFEAEVFFTSGTLAAGQALVRRSDCEGWWDIELVLIDPAAAPTTTTT